MIIIKDSLPGINKKGSTYTQREGEKLNLNGALPERKKQGSSSGQGNVEDYRTKRAIFQN